MYDLKLLLNQTLNKIFLIPLSICPMSFWLFVYNHAGQLASQIHSWKGNNNQI